MGPIKVSIECKVNGTVFIKSEMIEDWVPKRTNKQANAVFHELLDDMRKRVKEFTSPKVKEEEPVLEDIEK